MCDSIKLFAIIDQMTEAEYEQGRYPAKGAEDDDETSSNFREQYPISPLSGAGFKITPLGMPIPGSDHTVFTVKNRRLYGRIDGYLVEVNPPACTVGHNRLLANSVPAAVLVGMWLLKYWLVSNGCTRAGIDAIQTGNAIIDSVTPTFLFPHKDENAARWSLAAFRSRSEVLCNKKAKGETADSDGKTGKKAAYSIPREQAKGSNEYIYTSYIKDREYKIDAYVKVPDAKNAFCSPTPKEFAIEQASKRMLRLGTKLNGKWLREYGTQDGRQYENRLDRMSGWLDHPEAYEAAFNLIRKKLRLDDNLRAKQIRETSIKNLNLSAFDKKLLRFHIKGGIAREHDDFLMLTDRQAGKVYSASYIRVKERTGIDFNISYDDQRNALYPELVELLAFSGEYEPDKELARYVFSRVSAEAAISRLMELVEIMLRDGPDSVPQKLKRTFDDDAVMPVAEPDSKFERALRSVEAVDSEDDFIDDDPDEN